MDRGSGKNANGTINIVLHENGIGDTCGEFMKDFVSPPILCNGR